MLYVKYSKKEEQNVNYRYRFVTQIGRSCYSYVPFLIFEFLFITQAMISFEMSTKYLTPSYPTQILF